MRSLHLRTLKLLSESDIPLTQVSADTGVNYFWLRSFRYGQIKDPSVNRVQAVFEYLTGRPLPLEL